MARPSETPSGEPGRGTPAPSHHTAGSPLPAPAVLTRPFGRSFASLDGIFAWVEEFFGAEGWGAVDHSTIDLIIEELFTNMVRYNPDGPATVEIGLRRVPGGVEILLVDPIAPLFDVTAVAPVDSETYRAEKRVGGLGLHLVRQFADEFHYEHRDGGSRITVRKNLEA